MLEQIDLSSVLRRLETYSKTGLMVIIHENQWVELYFRDGRLMCIGPVRTNANLGERLLKDGVISPVALKETLLVIGSAQRNETRMALTLMDLGYVSHEGLRTWATHNATEVLRALLSWTSGEVSFGEDAIPPTDRLLVALSVSALLASLSLASQPPSAKSLTLSPTTIEGNLALIQSQMIHMPTISEKSEQHNLIFEELLILQPPPQDFRSSFLTFTHQECLYVGAKCSMVVRKISLT